MRCMYPRCAISNSGSALIETLLQYPPHVYGSHIASYQINSEHAGDTASRVAIIRASFCYLSIFQS